MNATTQMYSQLNWPADKIIDRISNDNKGLYYPILEILAESQEKWTTTKLREETLADDTQSIRHRVKVLRDMGLATYTRHLGDGEWNASTTEITDAGEWFFEQNRDLLEHEKTTINEVLIDLRERVETLEQQNVNELEERLSRIENALLNAAQQ